MELEDLKLSSTLRDAKDAVAATGAGPGGGTGSLLGLWPGELDDGRDWMGEDGGRVESRTCMAGGEDVGGGNTRCRLGEGAIGRSLRRFCARIEGA